MATQLCLLPPEPVVAAPRRARPRRVAPPTGAVVSAPAAPSPPADDHLDDHTREVGRRGIEAARQALAAAVARSTAA